MASEVKGEEKGSYRTRTYIFEMFLHYYTSPKKEPQCHILEVSPEDCDIYLFS